MPVTMEFRGATLLVVGDGEDTFEAMKRGIAEATLDPRFRPGTTLLIDARRSFAPLASEDIRQRVDFLHALVERGFSPRIGLLMREAPRSLLNAMQGDGSVALSRRTGLQFRAFESEGEALAWLAADGLPPLR